VKHLISGIKDPTELFFQNLNEDEMKKIKEEVGYYIQDERYINSVKYFKKLKLCERIDEEDKLKGHSSNNNLKNLNNLEINKAKSCRTKEYQSSKDYKSMIEQFKEKLMRENVKSIISKQKKWEKQAITQNPIHAGENEVKKPQKPSKSVHSEGLKVVVKDSFNILQENVKRRNIETSLRTVRLQKKK